MFKPKDHVLLSADCSIDRDKQELAMCTTSNFAAGTLAPHAAAAGDKESLDAAAFPFLFLCSTS